MATEDKTVKVTEESAPDGSLTKKTKEYPPKKTISDWVGLIAQISASVAVIVSIIALAIGLYQFNAQQQSAQKQALDQQQQTTLQNYLGTMSDLLLNKDLRHSKKGDDIRAIAQAWTLTAVRNLDPIRKGTLIRFLWEANLINGQAPIISLNGAGLDGIYIGNADLSGANLSGANLSGAENLSQEQLDEVYSCQGTTGLPQGLACHRT